MGENRIKGLVFMVLALSIASQSSYAGFDEEEIIGEVRSTRRNILDTYDNRKIIYPGRISLQDKGAYIYSIVDPVPLEPRLAVGTVRAVEAGTNELEFYIYSNYPEIINRWEILIYPEEDRHRIEPVDRIEGTEIALNTPITWKSTGRYSEGESLVYTLKVYDELGNYDQTTFKEIRFLKKSEISLESISEENKIYGANERVIGNIPVNGSRIRIYGKGLDNIENLDIDGQKINIDGEGNFAYETYSKRPGEKIIDVLLEDEAGGQYDYKMSVNIPERYDFLVGMADLYVGKHYVKDNNAILSNSPEYDGDTYGTGRLAFYYKGLWNGGYRVTAQADTWASEFKDLFKDFTKRTPRELFEKLEREDIEFNLGDDSTYYRDTDTAGKMYLKLEKNKSYGLWGSFDTGFNGNYYADYDRSLYGAKLEYNSMEPNSFGESRHQLKGFISEAETLFTSDEFQGTGGSVYFLSFQDIVVGSAKLRVEIRDPRTGRVISSVFLEEYTDYEISEIQGRIILKNPLPTIISRSPSGEIIKEDPYYGNNVILVADYEFYSKETDFSETTYGLKGRTWLTDNIALGGTMVSEARGDDIEDYELQGIDLTFRKTDNTYLRLEAAHSKGTQALINNFSYNGGYDFIESGDLASRYDGIDGYAYYIEGETALRDFSDRFSSSDRMGFWYRRKERGFSRAGLEDSAQVDDYGFEADYQLNERWDLSFGASRYTEEDDDFVNPEYSKLEEDRVNLILGYQYTNKLKLSGEVEYLKNKEWDINNESDFEDEEAVLLGVRGDYELQPGKTIYAEVQTDVYSDNYGANNLVTLGTDLRIGEKLSLNAEGSTGSRGQGVQIGAGYDFNPDHSLYAGYALDNSGDIFSNGNESTFTVGQKYRYSDRTNLYHENQYVRQNSGNGFLQTYGIDYDYSKDMVLGALIQHGDLDTDNGNVERSTASIYGRYYTRDFSMRNKLEYGRDRGNNSSADTWATINRAKKVIDDQYTLFGKAYYIYRDSFYDDDDKSAEIGVGVAYRPIWNDRLNFIGKYEYVYNIGIDSQYNSTNDEKAHVLSLEAVYEINQRWDIGGKYAMRFESMRDGQGEGDWYDSELDLYAVRVNYEFIKRWYAFAEYHLLRDIKDDSYEHGAIIALYREVNQYFKAGVGYNFSKFDDDLTDLSYNAQGWFINLIGKF